MLRRSVRSIIERRWADSRAFEEARACTDLDSIIHSLTVYRTMPSMTVVFPKSQRRYRSMVQRCFTILSHSYSIPTI